MAVRVPPPLCSVLLHATAAAVRTESTASLSVPGISNRSKMSSPPPAPPSYTTLKDRATAELVVKKSKFIAIAAPITDERSAHSFLNEVQDPRATHNCWAYKLGDQYRSNDDGEPSGTAGKPIYSAIVSSGIDMVMVVVIRYFGGIELGTGGLIRAYGGVALECLKGATTCFVKPKAPIGVEVPFEFLGIVYHQITITTIENDSFKHLYFHQVTSLESTEIWNTARPFQKHEKLQSFKVEDIHQDYDTGKDGFTMVTFKVDYNQIEDLESSLNNTCRRKLEFFKH